MSSETANIGLVLPELSEAFDLEEHWNHNSRIIDAEVGAAKQTIAEHTQDIEGLKQTTTAQGQLIAGKQDELTFDSAPTSGSNNPVKSGGIYSDQQRQDNEINTKITLADVFGAGQLIADNADLNDYTTGGKYYGGNTAGNTVLNLPIANGSFTFSLEVKQATPSMTYQYLRVCRNADDPYIYVRRKYNSWGSWYRFTGEVAAAVQSAPASLMQAGRIDAELTDAQEVTDDA